MQIPANRTLRPVYYPVSELFRVKLPLSTQQFQLCRDHEPALDLDTGVIFLRKNTGDSSARCLGDFLGLILVP